jgi:WD40 repeat protein
MRMIRHNASRARIGVCLAVALVAVACTGNPAQPPLTDLHLPGVRNIADLDALQRTNQIIYEAAAYSSPDSSDTRVIFGVNVGHIYSIGLSGRDLRPIKGGAPCYGSLAPAPDGRWVACSDSGGIEIIALAPDVSPASVQLLKAAYLESMWSPVWSPDGNVLAIIIRVHKADCMVALYEVPSNRLTAQLLATLAFPMFINTSGGQCGLRTISWSRDGAWLALVAFGAGPNSNENVYVLSLDKLLPLARTTASTPASVTVAQDDLVLFSQDQQSTRVAWSSQGARQLLTILEQDSRAITQVELLSGLRTSLLKIPNADNGDTRNYGFVCAVAWTPDSARLIFVDCAPGAIEVPAVPSQLYVYTPPALSV